MIKKLLVAINGSEGSIKAAMYAIMMARDYNIGLKFVYVIDSATIRYLGINQMLAKDEETDYKVDLCYEGQNYLEYAQSLAATKGVVAQTELREYFLYKVVVDLFSENFPKLTVCIHEIEGKELFAHAVRNGPADKFKGLDSVSNSLALTFICEEYLVPALQFACVKHLFHRLLQFPPSRPVLHGKEDAGDTSLLDVCLLVIKSYPLLNRD